MVGSVEDRLSSRRSSVRIVTGFGRLRKKSVRNSTDTMPLTARGPGPGPGGGSTTANGSIDTNPSNVPSAPEGSPGKKKGANERLSLNAQMQTYAGSKSGIPYSQSFYPRNSTPSPTPTTTSSPNANHQLTHKLDITPMLILSITFISR